jgi:hypothetical protein
MKDYLKDVLASSYQNKKTAQNTLEKYGAKVDKELSGKEAKVFINEDGTPNIAVRGSKNIKDFLISDPLLALGLSKYDPRKKRTDELIQRVKDKYQVDPNLYGHSLGGALVSGANTKGKITTFNKGAGLSELFKPIPSNQTDIRTTGDLVSVLSATQPGGQKKLVNNPNILSAHSISNL